MVEALGLDGCELQNTTTNRKMVPIGWDFCEVRPGHGGTYGVPLFGSRIERWIKTRKYT